MYATPCGSVTSLMIRLISGWNEPQLVSAFSSAFTASTSCAPARAASAMLVLRPAKQEQIGPKSDHATEWSGWNVGALTASTPARAVDGLPMGGVAEPPARPSPAQRPPVPLAGIRAIHTVVRFVVSPLTLCGMRRSACVCNRAAVRRRSYRLVRPRPPARPSSPSPCRTSPSPRPDHG